MLWIDQRALRIAWTVFLFALVLLTIYKIESTLVIFLLAIFLAHLLAPVVERVHLWIPPLGSRAPAILLVYMVVIALLTALAIPIGSKIGEEAAALAKRLPRSISAEPLANVPLPHWLESSRDDLDQVIRDRLQELSQNAIPIFTSASEHVVVGLGTVFRIMLIPILGYFFLKDGIKMRRMLVHSVPPGSRDLLAGILMDLHVLLLSYIRALVTLAIATFVSYSSVLAIMGVPYPVLLAGIAALLEVIPVIGPFTGAAIILLVALFSGYSHLVWLLLFLILYRIFQDYVLSPLVMSAGVALHPLLVLLGVLAGEQLGGIPGMFFSVPVIAALRAIFSRLREHDEETA